MEHWRSSLIDDEVIQSYSGIAGRIDIMPACCMSCKYALPFSELVVFIQFAAVAQALYQFGSTSMVACSDMQTCMLVHCMQRAGICAQAMLLHFVDLCTRRCNS